MATVARPARRREESESLVLLTVALALLLGLLVRFMVLDRMDSVTVGSTTLAIPATWGTTSEERALLSAADMQSGGTFGARVAVFEMPKNELLPVEGGLDEAATSWSLQRGEGLTGYRILGVAPTQVEGRDAMTVEYAYLATSPFGAASGAMPGLMRGFDTIVASEDRFHVLTFAVESSEFARLTSAQLPRFRSVYEDILRSWRIG